MAAEEEQTQHDAAMEVQDDEDQEMRIEKRLTKWIRSTALLFTVLLVIVGSVVPFLKGYPLHDHWDDIGKKLVLLCMGLLVACMYSAGTSYNFWTYLRAIRKSHRIFAPPGVNRKKTGSD
jgi:hypothetical protein